MNARQYVVTEAFLIKLMRVTARTQLSACQGGREDIPDNETLTACLDMALTVEALCPTPDDAA